MCPSTAPNHHHAALTSLPKCEHHMHLEGSLSPELLFVLSTRNSIALPSPSIDPAFASPASLLARYDNFSSLSDFLHYYYLSLSVLRTPADYEALAYAYFARAHADGVHHAEVFFDPQAHTPRGIALSTLVAGFARAQARALADFSLSSELIMCFLRHLPSSGAAGVDAESAFEEALAAGYFRDGSIKGIGLDSAEVGNPPELFAGVYARAAEVGVKRTAHAGEEGDASYISRALDVCGVERIDHGIRLAEDAELMERVVREGLMLTVCPLSNVKLRCVQSVKELPIRLFLDKGVKFSLNSDDPAYFGGYMLDNYCAVQEAFGLSVAEWVTIATNSVEGSWCGEQRKRELLVAVEKWESKWQGKF